MQDKNMSVKWANRICISLCREGYLPREIRVRFVRRGETLQCMRTDEGSSLSEDA